MSVTYKTHIGELITDACCNATGSISTWEDNLNLNNYEDWNPDISDEIIVDGVVSSTFQQQLINKPINNFGEDSSQESSLNSLLNSITPEIQELPENIVPIIIGYLVKPNEEIRDVVLNATGTIINWEDVLN